LRFLPSDDALDRNPNRASDSHNAECLGEPVCRCSRQREPFLNVADLAESRRVLVLVSVCGRFYHAEPPSTVSHWASLWEMRLSRFTYAVRDKLFLAHSHVCFALIVQKVQRKCARTVVLREQILSLPISTELRELGLVDGDGFAVAGRISVQISAPAYT
jgi:hypothetical protein